jgi:hypothetical protein
MKRARPWIFSLAVFEPDRQFQKEGTIVETMFGKLQTVSFARPRKKKTGNGELFI